MKINNITKKVCLGATALLAAISFNSCTDKNDWDVDASYDRLFHTTSLSVTPQDDRVGIEFKKMPNTTKYIVEISTDTLNNEVEENYVSTNTKDSSCVLFFKAVLTDSFSPVGD